MTEGFQLSTPELEMEIKLVELDKLHIHEEIIPEMLENLVGKIKSDVEMKHPIIVDSKTMVVIDGMHRVAALKRLGCRYILVCLVDYMNPKVELWCWNRVIHGKIEEAQLLERFRSIGLTAEPTTEENAVKELGERKNLSILLTKNSCYSVKGESSGIRETYEHIKRIERSLKEAGLKITYETETDSKTKLKAGGARAVLSVPRVEKEEVLEEALAGRVFAHKTTRHIIPARPIDVNAPVEWLKSDKPLDELNRALLEKLSGKKVRRLPKGTVLDRRYEEELWAFED
jgi:hypothetical protein